jgi:hypothetical protein
MRDRHQRRLPPLLAPPRSLAGQYLRASRPTLDRAVFARCVQASLDTIEELAPGSLAGVDVWIDEVPDVSQTWSRRLPLAICVGPESDRPTQIILYRRPIELRVQGPEALQRLTYLTLAEQVADLTGVSFASLDPHHWREQ